MAWFDNLLYVYFYSAACVVYLPLAAEASMFLFPGLPRPVVLVASSLGKTTGAYLVFLAGDYFSRTRLSKSAWQAIGRKIATTRAARIWGEISARVEMLIANYGFWGLLLIMAIPSGPSRTAVYTASLMRMKAIKIVLAVFVGTLVRNSLVYLGYVGVRFLAR